MSTEPIEGPVQPTDLPGRTKRSLVVGAVVLVAALIGIVMMYAAGELGMRICGNLHQQTYCKLQVAIDGGTFGACMTAAEASGMCESAGGP